MADCTIVVANKYPDLWEKFTEALKKYPPGLPVDIVRIDGDKKDFTYSKAMNEGLAQVETKYVCFMNDDAYPITEDWLLTLCQVISIGYVGVSPLERLSGRFNYDSMPPALAIRSDQKSANGASTLNGFCIVAETGLMKQVGGWDESLTHYYEDNDLSIRLEKFGWCAYVTTVTLIHAQKTSTKRTTDRDTERLVEESRERFVEKWGETHKEY